MRGYSGSGKSTKAREIANQTGAVVVNRDYLRKMLLGEWWTGKREDEDRVSIAEEAQVSALLKAGVSVVVDATHLNPSYLRRWARMASSLGADFEVVDVKTDLSTCLERDAERSEHGERFVGHKVILNQAKKFPVKKWPTIKPLPPFEVDPVEPDPDLPEAIIVDIDGTLAHMTGRSPYDYSRVDEDEVDPIIRELVEEWKYATDYPSRSVLIVSGRDGSCRDLTEKWLKENGCYWYDELLMRPEDAVDEHGNKLPDFKVKYDLFNKHIRGKYNIRFVLDDRDQVVNLWRQMGLKCFQVAPGDF
ncbi:polynucleotide kinase [Mycolicibacterium phlei RIVM601174]|nr:polynucleotide kinase [Mycolicibacterium phlei RIVM601174]MBF4194585.1 polynucleotide kinase [Mycolicibacterium phlei]